MALRDEWNGFTGGHWVDDINVRDFIQRNYTAYDGDDSFLAGPTDATDKLWGKVQELQAAERANNGVLECETEIVSGLTAYGAGYIDPEMKDLEQVVGLQTDKPLKRAFMPYGGIKMAQQAAENYGFHVNDKYNQIFNEYRKTHNQGVFDAYTPEMRAARHSHVITGLPDTYGRGRIVGDYRRVALYGIDRLIAGKQEDLLNCGGRTMTDDVVRAREEIAEQIRALKGMKEMAAAYGYDISQPATNAKEAVQWLYFGYLAAIKTQNGAAMSVFPPSWTSTSSATLPPVRSPRPRLRSSSTTWCSSCALSSSLVFRPIRLSSPATPSGLRSRSLALARTAVTW